jgi:hypothetical protein
MHSFFFAVQWGNSKEWCRLNGPSYGYASACRCEGSLRFALETNLDVTSTFILDILHGHKAQLQLRSRFGNPKGEYFLLHDNNGRSRGKRNVIAVARKLSLSCFILALNTTNMKLQKLNISIWIKERRQSQNPQNGSQF